VLARMSNTVPGNSNTVFLKFFLEVKLSKKRKIKSKIRLLDATAIGWHQRKYTGR